MNIIIYFPGNVSQALSILLVKCPEALSAVDCNGKMLLHHAIQYGMHWKDGLSVIVQTKIDVLSVKNVTSGLVPFMMAAEACRNVKGLNTIYELLCLDPSVLNQYLVKPGCALDDTLCSLFSTTVQKKENGNAKERLELSNEESMELRNRITQMEKDIMEMKKLLGV